MLKSFINPSKISKVSFPKTLKNLREALKSEHLTSDCNEKKANNEKGAIYRK